MGALNHVKPCVLTIGGSDSSCGAGIQADLKTISSQGCYGLTALTCVVAEVPDRVGELKSLPISLVKRQIELLFRAFPIRAVKTGLLCSPSIVRTVAQMLRHFISDRKLPVIVDPVMIASEGTPLATSDIPKAYEKYLVPLSTILTPNLDELGAFVGQPIASYSEMKQAGQELVKKWGISLWLKGGHLHGRSEDQKTATNCGPGNCDQGKSSFQSAQFLGKVAQDVLVTPSGGEWEYTSPFLANMSFHGTGCTLSAAIASQLALEKPLEQAIKIAKDYMDVVIRSHLAWGETRALEHFARD